MLNEKMNKREMIEFLNNSNVIIENVQKLTKKQIVEKYDEFVNNQKIQSSNNAIAIVENCENDENSNNFDLSKMSVQFAQFLNENEYNFQINETFTQFIIFGQSKTICVEIDDENEHSFVFTILNKKQKIVENRRNILRLKSLKATKSYTNCHVK